MEKNDVLARYAAMYRSIHDHALVRLQGWGNPQDPCRVLEIGAEPYVFTSRLFETFDWEIHCVSAPPCIWPGEMPPPQQRYVNIPAKNQMRQVQVTLLNVERDSLPYPDGYFDAALCMDVVQHLGYHPTRMFYEARRVLRTGGLLLLTLPNSLSLRRLLWLLGGIVDADPFAARGVYARRQRSIAPQEIEALISGCGFQIERREFLNLAPLPGATLPRILAIAARLLTSIALPPLYRRRDYIVLLATASRPLRAVYPAGIYHQARLYPPLAQDSPVQRN
ncbi:MAG: class I SAM-dependent methyltransferase [Roseiflexaceae bacterium]|nr:class I SAM-dependent methyltransferase [Roseiflexaceae bacterium]